ncbi:hypothetical protein TC41_2375 [Alicyclobacillus acidocaldarius subsp. acidocaldarius Tc-4-1]|uniref:Uncharacterized protein n=2 Tax=Alicyclobacillus acidocaldarius TaxID=405212 RepID=F8IGJ5_ALIAT|nr:hypothetical protein TC41_2375 [Alicyclobacillus acidocaldarius subsp. acidocaldarius Tc-4-1]
MPKKKLTTVVEDPEPRINGFTEAEWHEISVLIGEAIEAESPIRITLKEQAWRQSSRGRAIREGFEVVSALSGRFLRSGAAGADGQG